MIRAVLDTNVIVSAALSTGGPPGLIVKQWRSRAFEPIVSEALLLEYRTTLAAPRLQQRHRYDDRRIDQFMEEFRKTALFVEAVERIGTFVADPDDEKVLACALAGEADFIVSGDRHLLELGEHQGIPIIRPARFLAILLE